MINWRLYGSIALAVALLLTAIGLYVKGGNDREAVVRGEYATRDLQEAREANIALSGIVDRTRQKEAAWAQAFNQAGKSFQRKIDENATALLVANSVRLRDPGTPAVQTTCSGTAQVASDPKPVDAGGTELSPAFDRFLKSEASRANAVVLKLNFCIDTLEAERK